VWSFQFFRGFVPFDWFSSTIHFSIQFLFQWKPMDTITLRTPC
jgi:hypothetical protein